MRFILFALLIGSHLFGSALQDAINNAAPYSIIKLSKGIYRGSLVIDKPLTIIGDDSVIDGKSKGSIITIRSSNVVLKNLTLSNSGSRPDRLDSAIRLQNAQNCKIIDCNLTNTLYGITLTLSHDNLIQGNHITSKQNLSASQKGGGVKLWYSHNNTIINNTITSTKNNLIHFCKNTKIANNRFIDNMFALHLTRSSDITIRNNFFTKNSSAIVSMGNKNLLIANNRILSSKGAAAIAITLKGGANIKVVNNIIKFNAKAFFIDSKFIEKNLQRVIEYNTIAYNKEAFHFHQAIQNNQIRYNKIYGNISDVVKDLPSRYSAANTIEYNYWDQYRGFDRNNDNIGDTPYNVYQYSDRLWHYNNKVKFFFATPALSIIDFITKIAPFIEPNLLLQDTKPLFANSSID